MRGVYHQNDKQNERGHSLGLFFEKGKCPLWPREEISNIETILNRVYIICAGISRSLLCLIALRGINTGALLLIAYTNGA